MGGIRPIRQFDARLSGIRAGARGGGYYALQRFALGDFAPDLTLILDLPVETGLARAAARSPAADRFERLDPSFHDRLRQGFREIAAAEPGRCVLIDASGEPEAVHRGVFAAVAQRTRAGAQRLKRTHAAVSSPR